MPAASQPGSPPHPDFLIHRDGDSVAIAMRDLSPGEAHGGYLAGGGAVTVALTQPVPLGHKIALIQIAPGAEVIEYGVPIATAATAIEPGQHTHVHNLRSI